MKRHYRIRIAPRIRSSLPQPRDGARAQIVIAGKIDELPPVNNGCYPTARLDEPVNRPPLPTQMLAV